MFAFVVQSSLLKSFVSAVATVVPNRAIIPILSNIRVALSDNGRIELSASDARMYVSVILSAETYHGEGSICVPADKLIGVANSMIGSVTINVDDGIMSLHSVLGKDRKKATIRCVDAFGFPDQKESTDNKIYVSVEFSDLQQMVSKSFLTAAPADDLSPVMTGINIQLNKNEMMLSSTDRFRASLATVGVSSDEQLSAIVPAAAFATAMTVLDRTNAATISLEMGKDSIRLLSQEASIQITLISGNYPDLRKAIPTKFDATTRVPLKAVLQSFKDTSIMSKMLDLEVTTPTINGDAKLIVRGEDAEIGDFEQPFDVNITGKASRIIVNLEYASALFALLGRYGFTEVQLSISDKARSIVVRPIVIDSNGKALPDDRFVSFIMAVQKD